MNFSIKRSNLNQLLQKLIHIIHNNPRLPVLNYILLKIEKNNLSITSTNLSIEITATTLLDQEYPSKFIMMIPGRKLFEICRNLPENAEILISLKNNKIFIHSGNSNFHLSTMSSKNFPKSKQYENRFNITIPQSTLKTMIKLTHFAMANQDSRFYLNGIFFEISKNSIRIVATDGYRLAICETSIDSSLSVSKSVIIPRQSILEILNLLSTDQNMARIKINNSQICISISNYTLISQLIDSKFPNYNSIFPKIPKHIFEIDRIILKNALKRAAVLAHIKHRIINLDLVNNQLKITTHNFDQDTSEEILDISYSNENIQISFNVDYLLDIINIINSKNLKFYILDSISSVQIEGIPQLFGATYILMPIKI